MTPLDTLFVCLAAVQVAALGLLALAGLRLLETAQRARRNLQPLERTAMRTRRRGLHFVTRTRTDGGAALDRARQVLDRARRRATVTARIAREMLPEAQATAAAARVPARAAGQAAGTTVGLHRRLGRLGRAAAAAAAAVRTPPATAETTPSVPPPSSPAR